MSKLHFQSPSKPNTAIVTLDICDESDPVNSVPLCFCGDCFLEEEIVDTPLMPPSRMRRILSHVEPSSNTPRNLLHDVRSQLNGVTGEIPWCAEVTPALVAARSASRSTGFRSPAANYVASSSAGPEAEAKAAAVSPLRNPFFLCVKFLGLTTLGLTNSRSLLTRLLAIAGLDDRFERGRARFYCAGAVGKFTPVAVCRPSLRDLEIFSLRDCL